MMNTINPDLKSFAARSGKLIQFYGRDDGAFTPDWTTTYYGQMKDTVGHGSLEETGKLPAVHAPRVGHCG